MSFSVTLHSYPFIRKTPLTLLSVLTLCLCSSTPYACIISDSCSLWYPLFLWAYHPFIIVWSLMTIMQEISEFYLHSCYNSLHVIPSSTSLLLYYLLYLDNRNRNKNSGGKWELIYINSWKSNLLFFNTVIFKSDITFCSLWDNSVLLWQHLYTRRLRKCLLCSCSMRNTHFTIYEFIYNLQNFHSIAHISIPYYNLDEWFLLSGKRQLWYPGLNKIHQKQFWLY